MDTLEFFKKIMPESGVYYLAIFKDGYKYPTHKAYTDLETMAKAAIGYSKSDQLHVYYAMAAYNETYVEVEKDGVTKKKYRVKQNWDRAKAFWIDIDCGDKYADAEPPKGYRTQREAAAAVLTFCKTVQWPDPMMVSSGNGLHVYWPLSAALKPDVWTKLANALKAALKNENVLADPSRTADFASVLRPVGSLHKKDPTNPKVVKVLNKNEVPSYNPADLAAKMSEYVKANMLALPKTRAERPAPTDLNSDLTAHLTQYPDIPSDADLMADKCAQAAAVRDTQGDVEYEVWRLVLGLLTFCEDGRSKAEAWTARREETNHESVDWDVKYDTWDAGPTTCAKLCEVNARGCEGCQFKGKVTTPLQLGRVIPINEEIVEETVDEETGEAEEVVIPPLPHGYGWDNGVMTRYLPGSEGVLQAYPFCQNLFYPTSRIRTEDGTFKYGIRLHLPDKRVRDFQIPSECVASTTDLLRAVARYELTKSNHKNAGDHMAAYLLDQLQNLKKTVTEIETMTDFGWKENQKGFLLGETMLRKNGEHEKVLLGGAAKQKAATFDGTGGSLQVYSDSINFMYNREGAEHWQYALCSGWGSLLAHYCENLYNGLVFVLQGGDTGRGKTTVCHAAMAAFGDPEALTLKGKEGFTNNALWATLSVYSNVPVLVDELTGAEPAAFSNLAYGIANGKERARMQTRGGSVVFADSGSWRTNLYVTGNKDFQGLLAMHQANSQAEAVRIIQLNVDQFPKLDLVERSNFPDTEDGEEDWKAETAMVAKRHMKLITDNRGVAGAAMIQFILDNEAKVGRWMDKALTAFTKRFSDSKYRFYVAHSACTIVMANICSALGIVEFDVPNLQKFIASTVEDMVERVTETNTITPEDAFHRMVNQLSNRIIVTNEFRDRWDGRGAETPRNKVFGEIAGRYVLGTQNHKQHAGHLMLIQKEVREWCMNSRVDYHAMLAELQANGALLKTNEKVVVTRGTDYSAFQQRCLVVDTLKLNAGSGSPALSLVTDVDAEAASNV